MLEGIQSIVHVFHCLDKASLHYLCDETALDPHLPVTPAQLVLSVSCPVQ